MSDSPRELIDRARRVTGLSLAGLAARLGLKEATLYKAHGGHIALGGAARRALALLIEAQAAPHSAPAAGAQALRSARKAAASPAALPLEPLAEQLAFIHRHATPAELKILAGTLEAFHRQVAERRRAS